MIELVASILELFDIDLDVLGGGSTEGLFPPGPDATPASYWDDDAYLPETAEGWNLDEPQWRDQEFHSDAVSEAGFESAACNDLNAVADDTGFQTSGEHIDASAFDSGVETTIGDPHAAADYWNQQQSDYSCAISAQQSIINQLCDLSMTESQLAGLAERMGWYDPEIGTPPSHLASLLEWAGLSTEMTQSAEWSDLAEALSRGDSVLVGLDANEVYSSSLDQDGSLWEYADAGHAVQVTGMGVDASGREVVFLNDPGVPDGMGRTAHRDEFMNAWEDFGRIMVTARAPENAYV